MTPQAELVMELVAHEHASTLGREVEELFTSCLFRGSELANGVPADGLSPVVAEGITQTVGFHPQRIEQAKPKIVGFIGQIGDEFLKSKGGGWSFLNLCNDRHGRQWANLHRTMEQLVQLAIGVGLGGYLLPRETWSIFPGGMPYVWFDIPAERKASDEPESNEATS